MRVIIGSVGRRKYLVDWFKQAVAAEEIDAEVVTTENDELSAAANAGDRLIVAPRYESSEYEGFIRELLCTPEPTLFVSVNDYEITRISRFLDESSPNVNATHFIPEWRHQRVIEDKFLLATFLRSHGIKTPSTFLGSDITALDDLSRKSTELVVKHRFGSGSSGLQFVTGNELQEAIDRVALTAPNQTGSKVSNDATSLVVVQPLLKGVEFGVDGVFAPHGSGLLAGTLARQKVRMRSGETDKAVTVDASSFQPPVQKIGELFQLRGLIDMDFIVVPGQEPAVIDINPRFGGGYPFMHIAGANAPRFLVKTVFEGVSDPELLAYESNVTGAKYDNVARTSLT